MIDSPYLVEPGRKLNLAKRPTDDTGPFKDKEDAADAIAKNIKRLHELQEVLYAQSKHAILVVFQAMDCGGKDGAIEHVFGGVNPQGCQVTSFKVPTPLERAHDFLWRHHLAVPPKGMIGIFNRSHYEAVLVERVHKIALPEVWKRRYDDINDFERQLASEGTTILKFFLHISREEQKERLIARLEDKLKHWKFNVADLKERALWNEYQQAYQDALEKCSTKSAPWYIVPADRKWFRNWVISETIVQTLEKLKLRFPPAPPGLDKIVVK